MPPKLLAIKLDVDSTYLEICDGKRTVFMDQNRVAN